MIRVDHSALGFSKETQHIDIAIAYHMLKNADFFFTLTPLISTYLNYVAGPHLQTVTTDHFAAIHGIAVDDTSHSAIAVTDHSAIAVSHAVINLAQIRSQATFYA
jgi:hypothetical protein